MIKTVHQQGRDTVTQIIQSIIGVCAYMSVGKNDWQAIPFENSTVIEGREVKAVGIRIQRIKPLATPRTRIGKVVRGLLNNFEPIIVVKPMYESAKPQQVTAEIVVRGQAFASPDDFGLCLFRFCRFRNELNEILAKIEGVFSIEPKSGV